MVIDTSAVVAILFGEPEADVFAEAIEQDPVRLISAASALEVALVVESELGEEGGRERELLLLKAQITIAPFGPDQLAAARFAFKNIRQGAASGRSKLRRLLRLCTQQDHGRAVALQGRRFYED